jgi:hypothetical protein
MYKHKITVIFLLLIIFISHYATPVSAQNSINIIQNRAYANFPYSITFKLSTSSTNAIKEINLIYGTSERSCSQEIAIQKIEIEPRSSQSVSWNWSLVRSGNIPPSASIWWQWEITNLSNESLTTEKEYFQIEDASFTWQYYNDTDLEIYWAEGGQAFGKQIYRIARNSLDRLSQDFGISSNNTIRLMVYPSAQELQEATLFLPEWTGGVAFPTFDTVLVGVMPDEIDWAAEIIPHELAHIVAFQRTYNCEGIKIPTWFNEGIAVLAEDSFSDYDLKRIEVALKNDNLPSLAALSNNFDVKAEKASLSYIKSGFIIQYLIEKYGKDDFSAVLDCVQDGILFNTCIQEIYGLNTHQLDAQWLKDTFEIETSRLNVQGDHSSVFTPIPTLALWTPSISSNASSQTSEIINNDHTGSIAKYEQKQTEAPKQTETKNSNQLFRIWLLLLIPPLSLLAIILFRMKRKL